MDLKGIVNESHIFRDERILSSDPREFLPDRIFGREEQLVEIGNIFAPPFRAWSSSREVQPITNAALTGGPGTGKSVTISWYIKNQVEPLIKDIGVPLKICQVNCRELNTSYKVITQIGTFLDEGFKQKGLDATRAWAVSKEILDRAPVSFAVVLDGTDFLEPKSKDFLLYVLTRPGLEKSRLGFVLVSASKSRLYEGLSQDTRNSLGTPSPVEFGAYSKETLYDILRGRRGAFANGVLSEEIIRECANIGTAQGDARRALDILHLAGEIADEEQGERVEKRHLDRAYREIEGYYWVDTCSKLPRTHLLVVFAIAYLNYTEVQATARTVYDLYVKLASHFGVPENQVISLRRIREILTKDIPPLNIIEVKVQDKWKMFTFDVMIDPAEAYLGTKKLVEETVGPVVDAELERMVKELKLS